MSTNAFTIINLSALALALAGESLTAYPVQVLIAHILFVAVLAMSYRWTNR